jgi:mitochondrial fission protein ELM1
VITDGKMGMEVQVVGVASALECAFAIKRVSPRGLWRLLAPWAPIDPAERFGKPQSQFAPPFPDIAIATGRLSIPALRAVRKASPETFTVIIQDPRTGTGSADLIAVPRHDTLAGENVIHTLTAPHTFPPERLAELRASPPKDIAALPGIKVAVVLGGPNAIYRYSDATIQKLAHSLGSLAALDTSFLVTVSRRTPEPLLRAVVDAIGDSPRIVWDGTGDNPYKQFLAQADQFVVTADSVNITGEACATGRPVYVFGPEGGSAKFSRFHDALRRYGATRMLPERFERLESWEYAPLASAHEIAREIERRWCARHDIGTSQGKT